MNRLLEYLTPFVFIILGLLIKFEYYTPSSRLSRISPWFLIIAGIIVLFLKIYEQYFSKKVVDTMKKIDIKSKMCYWLAVFFTFIFLLFMFEDIFLNSAMNDLFRIGGLFGLAYCSMSIFEKSKSK